MELEIVIAVLLLVLALHDTLAGLVAAVVLAGLSVFQLGPCPYMAWLRSNWTGPALACWVAS